MAIQQKINREIAEKAPIPMLDLKAQYKSLGQEIEAAIREILESGHFVLGEHVGAFEREIADYHNVKYAVSIASGRLFDYSK